MLTVAEREVRRGGIGGSDVAAILGLSKWKTAHELYLEKIDDTPLEEETETPEYLHFGDVLEDVVAKEFERRNDLKVQRRKEIFRHPEYDFMLANIDRKVVGVKAVLECKTSGAFMVSEWGPSGSDEFPDYYRVQLDHYMNVLGYDQGYLSVLIGGNQYRQYYCKQDVELSEIIMQANIEFWERVTTRNPPDIDFAHRSTEAMMNKLYPGTNGQTIFLPESLHPWQMVKEQAEARIKEDNAVVDACKNRIKNAMGEAAIGVVMPDKQVKYTRKKINKKAFEVAATSYIDMRSSKYAEGK